MMTYNIYCRIVAYVVTIVLHIGNATWMATSFYGEVMKNSHVRHFSEMQCYFFTCWTFTFQVIYAAIALYTDIFKLRNSKQQGYQLPKIVADCRDALYSILIWPSSMLVFVMFWSFFLYDRNLLYPEDIDLAISNISNHIMHTCIFFICMWEMLFRPRTPPTHHKWYILSVIAVESIYFSTVMGIYFFKGVYVYPIFGLLIGSRYLYVFFVAVAAVLFVFYHAQWAVNNFLWSAEIRRRTSEKSIPAARLNGANSIRKVK